MPDISEDEDSESVVSEDEDSESIVTEDRHDSGHISEAEYEDAQEKQEEDDSGDGEDAEDLAEDCGLLIADPGGATWKLPANLPQLKHVRNTRFICSGAFHSRSRF